MSKGSPFTQLWKQSEQKKESEKERVKLEVVETEAPPTTTHQVPPPTTHQENLPVSPVRDFSKVPNSLVRKAIPEGLFKGVSKNTYDALYQRTRGAINPVRSIRAKQSDLLLWANVSHNTLKGHLKHLQNVGLLKIHYQRGDNDGAEYEVFLPEEIGQGTTTHHPPPTTQKLGGPTTQKLDGGGWYLDQQNIGQNENPKTSFKTNTSDDDRARVSDVYSLMVERLDAAAKNLTGKSPLKQEADKWGDLADLLILELEVAAARAGGVSSVPAFLTEVLRRQFFVARQKPAAKSTKTKPDTVGKSDQGNYEIKPLDEQGREAALEQLQEFAGDDLLQGFERWYTVEDWQWLTEQLEKGKEN